MFQQSRWRWVAAISVIVLAGLAVGWFVWSQGPSSPSELAACLPEKGGTLVYLDLGAMRRSGLLNLIAGARATEEPEYKQFVEQSGFDYLHDLDAVAGTIRGGQVFFAVRGKFQWDRLIEYARQHGGTCRGIFCSLQGSTPERRISFYKIQNGLMGMAVSQDDMAAYQVTLHASHPNPFTPDAPVWALVPRAVLKDTVAFPPGIRSYAMAVEDADRVVVSAAPSGDHIEIALNVTCSSPEQASSLLIQLENTTRLLRQLMARQKVKPDPAELTSVLANGSFRREDRRVIGQWPIQRAFLDGLGGSAH